MTDRRRWSAVALALVAIVVGGGTHRAQATVRFGDLNISGNLQSQNLARTPDPSTWEYIQNRNTAHISLDYDWLKGGKFIGKYNIPFIEASQLSILWRGVYDGVYGFTPGFLQKEDIHGRAYGSNGNLTLFQAATQQGINVPLKNGTQATRFFTTNQLELTGLSHGELDALAFENQLREAYVDLKMRGVPLSIRAGRQQIVWGETDNFRMLDRANSLDLSWHFQQEIPAPGFGWDEIRRPFWMIKFLYDLDQVGPLAQSFLEWYWNPGDWYPAKQAYLPQPWGLPFYNSLTNPYDGAFYFGNCSTDSPYVVPGGPRKGQRACTALMNGTRLFEQGNYSRNALDNSQVGVRYHGIAPFGLEFTLNYFYQRFAGDDGTNYAPIRALADTPENNVRAANLYKQGIFPAEAYSPYVHTVGISANYSDEEYTQTVWRFESIYDIGVPFFDASKVTVVSTPALPGITKKNMWKGMVGFDRPTWMRFLNKKSTIFLSGQFFWHYLTNDNQCPVTVRDPNTGQVTYHGYGGQTVANLLATQRKKYHQNVGECLVGGLDLPSGLRGSSVAFRDKVRTWESLFTFAAFTFYKGGSIVPTLGFAVDPVNQWNMEPFWAVDYVLRDDLVVNLAQRYFFTPRGRSTPIFETWGLAGLNAGRSETSLRLTYQF
jgi:hypothetical protein